MIKHTENEVYTFLRSLENVQRFTKRELEKELQSFFGVNNKMHDSTITDDRTLDYAFTFTSEQENTNHYCDVEIYYLKTRNGGVYVTETTLLEFVS